MAKDWGQRLTVQPKSRAPSPIWGIPDSLSIGKRLTHRGRPQGPARSARHLPPGAAVGEEVGGVAWSRGHERPAGGWLCGWGQVSGAWSAKPLQRTAGCSANTRGPGPHGPSRSREHRAPTCPAGEVPPPTESKMGIRVPDCRPDVLGAQSPKE
jgi:hypothetical protein